MSIGEIVDKIESYERVQLRKIKQKAIINDVLSEQIANKVSKIFDKDNDVQILRVWDLFPKLFEEEKKKYEEEKEMNEFEKFKRDRRAFAMRYNARTRKGGK